MGFGGFRADGLVHPVFKQPPGEGAAGHYFTFRVGNGGGKGELGGSRQGTCLSFLPDEDTPAPVSRRGTVL